VRISLVFSDLGFQALFVLALHPGAILETYQMWWCPNVGEAKDLLRKAREAMKAKTLPELWWRLWAASVLFDVDITLHSLDVNCIDDNIVTTDLIRRHALEAFADGHEMILLAETFAVDEHIVVFDM